MEKQIDTKKLRLPFALLVIAILVATIVIYLPPKALIHVTKVPSFFYGIALLILLTGILVLAGIFIWKWFTIIQNEQSRELKESEARQKIDLEKVINCGAETRRHHDQLCNLATDLSKIIAASKSTVEKTDDKSEFIEKPVETKNTKTNKTTEKTETANSQVFMPLIEEYIKHLNSSPNLKSNV